MEKIILRKCTVLIFFFKQKTAYEMRISDWSSDVCSSDLGGFVYMDTGSQNYSSFRPGYIESAGAHTHSFTTASKGGGEAHPIVQPTIILNKIIKARSV